MNKDDKRPNFFQRVFKNKLELKTTIILILITSLVSSFVGGTLFTRTFSRNNQHLFKAGVVDNPSLVTQIAKKAGPSIVGIRMMVRASLNQFFSKQSQIEGSGIIINQAGYIMTNYHVVQYADPRNTNHQRVTLEVFLPDKRQARAKFIGGDPLNDLAVIQVNLKNLPVAELGDSSKLEVGELAVAIGNPLGLEFAGSVTSGVVSALNRTVSVEDKTMTLIQTDAAINPGNSGGALVNSEGKVIGINTIKISVSGVEGLGFAIPIDDARPIVSQLMRYGYIKGRPLIGISGRDITEALAQYYKLPIGIFIIDVRPGSGAANAGIRKKDILVSVAGKKVASMKDLNHIKKAYKAGDTVNAGVVREKKRLSLKITFSEEH
jgi:serine protease Do